MPPRAIPVDIRHARPQESGNYWGRKLRLVLSATVAAVAFVFFHLDAGIASAQPAAAPETAAAGTSSTDADASEPVAPPISIEPAASVPPGQLAAEPPSEPAAPPLALAPPDRPVVLPAGAGIEFVTLTDLSSKTSYLGERFDVVTTRDQIIDGQVLIPEGTWGVGEISLMVRKGGFGKPGRIDIRLVSMTLGDRQVALGGTREVRGKSGAGETVIGAAAIGIYSFAITGKSAVLPSGAAVTGIVKKDVALPARLAADRLTEPAPAEITETPEP